ncbi:C-X-C chemokine receptor type 2-like [Dunckerocampus dactyliophorus]|uniref:C-X-C chemokine receptor type 2-like n=1 Tax=Dunckerocampus dactyliophorus TaxID=161453 RepID=UPI0024072E70|nr:C-X-C chemokine receptor type 2-like [Dunckerocampus dactyliophorus]
MSIIVPFDDGYFDILDDYTHSNHTVYVVDPSTLPCEVRPLDAGAATALSVLLAAIFLLAIPGNLLVACVIAHSRRSLTASDVYLFHLTVADGLMALTVPFWAAALTHGWIFGDGMCKALNLIFEANFYTSILFLACISVDRYLVIVHANEALRSPQRKCSRLLCAAVWAFGSALALPALFNDATKLDQDSDRMLCTESFDIGSAPLWRMATRGFRHIFGFLLPLAVMLSCYGITITRLLQTRGFQKHRAMRVIVAVVVGFLLCWTPYHLALMVDTLLRAELIRFDCSMRQAVSMALVLSNSLALLHSGINPLLYAFVGEKFRKNMSTLLHRKVRQEGASGSKFSRSTSQTSDGHGAVA